MVKLNFKEFINEVTADQVNYAATLLRQAAQKPQQALVAANNLQVMAKNPQYAKTMAQAKTVDELLKMTQQNVGNITKQIEAIIKTLSPQQAQAILQDKDAKATATKQIAGQLKPPMNFQLLQNIKYLKQPAIQKMLQAQTGQGQQEFNFTNPQQQAPQKNNDLLGLQPEPATT